MTDSHSKLFIGWEEWFAFPDLHLPAVKAKVDTGAKTSCLHAFNIKPVTRNGSPYVRFWIHPVQRNKKIYRECLAPLIDRRYVTNSGGQREKRYVIQTHIKLGELSWPIEVTLTCRDTMAFRMLLGREAMRTGNLIVDPAKSCINGTFKSKELKLFYNIKS